MSAVATKKDTSAKWLEQFELTAANRLGAAHAAGLEKQQKAIEGFAETGIPDKKVEDYKYTNIRLYLNDEFALKGAATRLRQSDVRHLFFGGHATILMENGRFVQELSSLKNLPREVIVKNLFTVLKATDTGAGREFNEQFDEKASPMAMLNTALTQ